MTVSQEGVMETCFKNMRHTSQKQPEKRGRTESAHLQPKIYRERHKSRVSIRGKNSPRFPFLGEKRKYRIIREGAGISNRQSLPALGP